jgi:hypothetical protein
VKPSGSPVPPTPRQPKIRPEPPDALTASGFSGKIRKQARNHGEIYEFLFQVPQALRSGRGDLAGGGGDVHHVAAAAGLRRGQ